MHEHLLADDPGVSRELSLPRIVAQDQHHLAGGGRCVFREQRATERQRHAEHPECVARHDAPDHGALVGPRGHVPVREALGRDGQLAQLLVLPPGEGIPPATPVPERRFVERAAVAQRDRPEHIGIEDREHAGVQPEAERDREHDRGDEGWGPSKATEREPDVLPQLLKPGRRPPSSRGALQRSQATDLGRDRTRSWQEVT